MAAAATTSTIELRHVSCSPSSKKKFPSTTFFAASSNDNVENPKKYLTQQNLIKFQAKLEKFKKNLTMAFSAMSSARSDDFQDKMKVINSSCDQLIKLLSNGKIVNFDENERIKPASNRRYEVNSGENQIYDKHLSNLHNGFIEYQTENGMLKHRLAEIDTKICEILNENDFLRWENEQYKLEMDGLRDQLDKENLQTKELKAEICCLKLNQDQINHIHSVRLKDELSTAWDIAKITEESLRRKMEDFEREAKLKEMEYKKRIEVLEDEMMEKTALLRKFEQKVEYLTDENSKITQIYAKSKAEMEEELQRLYNQETEPLQIQPSNKPSSIDYSTSDEYQNSYPFITNFEDDLQNRLNDFSATLENNNSKDLQYLLNEKSLQNFDLREKIVFLEEECRAVKDENENSKTLLQQMKKDMKVLLDTVKKDYD